MNLIEAIRSGLPFRRPHWVEPDFELQWVIFVPEDFSQCQLYWEDHSTFGNITNDMLFADDFETKEVSEL